VGPQGRGLAPLRRLRTPVTSTTSVTATDSAPSVAEETKKEPPKKEPTKLAERMYDRRHQVLMAGLSKAGLYDLAPDDVTAVQTLVDRLDETTVRTLADWLATAAER
jgi:hypothetical protein